MVCSFLLDTQQYGRFLFGGGWLVAASQAKREKKTTYHKRRRREEERLERNKTTERNFMNRITISIIYHHED